MSAHFSRGETQPFILEEVAQPLFVFPDGSFEGNRLAARVKHHLHFVHGQIGAFRRFRCGVGSPPELFQEFVEDLEETGSSVR